ncbi:tryptophan-rich sensory protein [Thermithiobacillus plumbiphilus]|uniref:Tryptophan-rich sensory protein n=1 Tax=Thermithiobacillus plumbiphilus TaxID=1729899 RepID=A0ABU9D5K9_9PROT
MREGLLTRSGEFGGMLAQAPAGTGPVFPQIPDLPLVIFSSASFALLFSVGVAVFLFIKSGERATAQTGIRFFFLQLLLGLVWLVLLFFLHLPGWAFAVVLVQWVVLLQTIVIFWRRLAVAGFLLLPYFVWVSLMVWLLGSLWRLQP